MLFNQNFNAITNAIPIANLDSTAKLDSTVPLNTYQNVRALALMSYDAYYNINDTQWVDPETNRTTDIRDTDQTVHAYLFSDVTGGVNIVSFKGTSLGITGGIVYNDRFNDNLFYSCCYYQQSGLFDKKDCECTRVEGTCDTPGTPGTPDTPGTPKQKGQCYSQCYQNSTNYANNYYILSKKIMEKVASTIDIRKTQVVLTGHSLGGTLATLMGLDYDLPVVTFNSPGEKNYASNTGIKYKQATLQKIYHFGHNADTIFTGKCNGLLSWCHLAGYNVETKCHLGNVCQYNATGLLGIRESIFTHPIKYIIANIIPHWEEKMPECTLNTHCTECQDWAYN